MLMNLDLSDYSDDFTWEQKLNQAGQLDDITLKTTFEIIASKVVSRETFQVIRTLFSQSLRPPRGKEIRVFSDSSG